MKTLKKKLRNKTKTESEEDIKIKLNSRRKNAIFILSTIVLAGLVGTYFVLEFASSRNRIILATTTSTYDSGLLDYLLPTFEEKYGITVEIISVGNGQRVIGLIQPAFIPSARAFSTAERTILAATP